MEDAEVVAAIVAGDPAGLAEALDKYAVTLYGYCLSVLTQGALPADGAAMAVLDTFVVATSKLDELADPARLGAWLHAVARNDVRRQVLAVGMTPREPGDGEQQPARFLPDGLRGQIVAACTDDTPAGRARRVSAAHLAGPFGRGGFPKAVGRPRPPAWRRVPVLAAAGGTLAVITAGALALALSGSHSATQAADDVGPPSGGAVTFSAGPATTGAPVSLQATRKAPHKAPHARKTRTAAAPRGSRTPPPASPSPAPATASPSPSASPSRSPAPAPGVLVVSPATIVVTSARGAMGYTSFTIGAAGGPVNYKITVGEGPGLVIVSPASGHLDAGEQVTISVAAASAGTVARTITLSPDGVVALYIFSMKK